MCSIWNGLTEISEGLVLAWKYGRGFSLPQESLPWEQGVERWRACPHLLLGEWKTGRPRLSSEFLGASPTADIHGVQPGHLVICLL